MSTRIKDRRHFEERTTRALVRIAVESYASRRSWKAIRVLHFRGTRDVFEGGKRLCQSQNSLEREIGAHILAQLGVTKKTFMAESVKILVCLLGDQVDDVVVAAGVALGHRDSPKAVPHLIKLKNHKNHLVRYAVTSGLGGQESKKATGALIELSKDSSALVRDWATFALGVIINRDTKRIRDALLACLVDEDAAVRGQSLIGLVRRKDKRVLGPLRQELGRELEGDWALEAAALSRHRSLYPVLLKLRRQKECAAGHWLYSDLEAAIAACRPRKR